MDFDNLLHLFSSCALLDRAPYNIFFTYGLLRPLCLKSDNDAVQCHCRTELSPLLRKSRVPWQDQVVAKGAAENKKTVIIVLIPFLSIVSLYSTAKLISGHNNIFSFNYFEQS